MLIGLGCQLLIEVTMPKRHMIKTSRRCADKVSCILALVIQRKTEWGRRFCMYFERRGG
jgi:hypothetical protein